MAAVHHHSLIFGSFTPNFHMGQFGCCITALDGRKRFTYFVPGKAKFCLCNYDDDLWIRLEAFEQARCGSNRSICRNRWRRTRDDGHTADLSLLQLAEG